jgi:cellobiose-specific phosphotransferase system component IIA
LALRYVINHGKIDTPINHEIAHGMLGSGLSNARKTLESLKKTDKKFDINTQINTKDLALNEAFLIYQNLVSKWNSKNEREIASLFIQYQDYKVVAEKVGVNRSQIWKKERSLNISSYFAIKNVIAYLSR